MIQDAEDTERLGVAADSCFFDDVDTLSELLTHTQYYSCEVLGHVKESLVQAFVDYWMFAEWSGVEFFTEILSDMTVSKDRLLANILLRRLAECGSSRYPRTSYAVTTLKDYMRHSRREFYVEYVILLERQRLMVVSLSFDVF